METFRNFHKYDNIRERMDLMDHFFVEVRGQSQISWLDCGWCCTWAGNEWTISLSMILVLSKEEEVRDISFLLEQEN